MTSRQRLAYIILQLNFDYCSWREALRLARAAARGSRAPEAAQAAEAVRSALDAADAALRAIHGRTPERTPVRELVPA
jgi:hypothetical protein